MKLRNIPKTERLSNDSKTFFQTMIEYESGKWKIGEEKKFLRFFDDNDLYNVKKYAKTVEPEKIIDFIEVMFAPTKFEYLVYDEKFSENMNKLYRKYDQKKLQIWCEGPVLLIDAAQIMLKINLIYK